MAYVTSVGLVRVNRNYHKSPRDLAFEAASKALENVKLDTIDYVIVASSLTYLQASQFDLAAYIARELGVHVKSAFAIEAGENSGLAGAEVALNLIRSHAAERILLVGVDKLTEYISNKTYKMIQAIYDTESDAVYNVGHAGPMALLMRLYMDRYGVDRETLAHWPVMMHAHGKENPYAMLRFTVTPDKVVNAMPIAEPITLLDAYPLGDGAAAVLLSSEDQGGDHLARLSEVYSSIGFQSIALRDDPLSIEAVGQIAREAGLNPEDIDVAEIHDSFTITGILLLEELGFAPRGKAAEMVAEGAFTKGGSGPLVNASGGLKARGHPKGATGVYMLAEVAMQLAGTFPGIKADSPRKGIAVGVNAHGSSARLAFLEAL